MLAELAVPVWLIDALSPFTAVWVMLAVLAVPEEDIVAWFATTEPPPPFWTMLAVLASPVSVTLALELN
jgi:hypothetical protein